MTYVRWYNPSQAFTAKHVSYPQLTATPLKAYCSAIWRIQFCIPFWLVDLSNTPIFLWEHFLKILVNKINFNLQILHSDGFDGKLCYFTSHISVLTNIVWLSSVNKIKNYLMKLFRYRFVSISSLKGKNHLFVEWQNSSSTDLIFFGLGRNLGSH